MNKLNSKWSAAIAGVALSFSLFSANSAKAVTVTFSQEGWQYGGELSGSFTGDDLNGDSIIEASELSDFRATFSGNVYVPLINPATGQPYQNFVTFSNILPSLEPPNVLSNLNFRYSSSTSQLSFSSGRVQCDIHDPFIGCRGASNLSSISVSSTGGFILFNRFPFPSGGGLTTSSSSAPIVGCPASNLQ